MGTAPVGRTTLFLALLLVIQVPARPGVSQTVERDSAGVHIVENQRPQASLNSIWFVHPEPTLDLTATGAGPEHEFFRVNSGVRLGDGRIVVANRGSNQVRVFSGTGQFLYAFGGPGEGPGEFRRLAWVARYRGDSLFAYDPGLGRWSVFTVDGTFGRSVRATTPEGLVLEDAQPFASGAVLGVRVMPPGDRIGTEFVGLRQEETTFMRFSPEGEFLNAIGTVPGPEVYFMQRPTGQSYYTYRPLLFGYSPAWAMSGNRVYAGTDQGFEIAGFSEGGILQHIVRIPGPERRVTRQQVDEAFERMTADARDRPPGLTYDLPYPESSPSLSRLVVDAFGNLWVSEYAQYFEDPSEWRVFDGNGRLLGTIRLPPRFQVFDIGSDFILGRSLDDLNVEHVLLLALSREGSGGRLE